MRFRSTKRYRNLPCAHRQHGHDGHCSLVHGYSRSFTFWFEASELDANNFVVDFSSLKKLGAWLEEMFDHTLLINEADPELPFFREMEARKLCALRVVPSVSMEGTALLAATFADELVRAQTGGRAWVVKVEVRENDKNSAEVELVGGPRGAQVRVDDR